MLATIQADPARYDDYKVYKVEVKDAEQMEEFKKLSDNVKVSGWQSAYKVAIQITFTI